MTRAEIRKIQRQLTAAGWRLRVDGVYGPATHAAYQEWLNAHTDDGMPAYAPPAAKPWWASRAMLGILASAVATLAGLAGWLVDADAITTLLVQAVEVGGLVLAFIGTLRRRAPLDPTLVAPGLRYPAAPPALSPDGQSDPRGLFRDS
jgi:hypothetical protein